MKFKRAFTLAEVLITLGIIGVVAALTMPTLIGNYRKKQTEVKLQKFYSLMSQAIQRWETDEGLEPNQVKFTVTYDENDKLNLVNDFRTWYNNNLDKYITNLDKSVKSGTITVNGDSWEEDRYIIKLADGSGFTAYLANQDTMFIFYCTEAKYCAPESYDGKNTFLFTFEKGKLYPGRNSLSSREYVLQSCKNAQEGRCTYCAQLIQMDGWKISEDYPIRF